MTTSTSFKLGPNDGHRADFMNLANRFMIESQTTDDRFALVHHTIAARKLAAPLHVHVREDEYSYVLSGRMGAQIGDEVVEAGPGELVFKPRGIWHAFWSASDEDTELLELISPGNFSHYFEEMAEALTSNEPDFEQIAAMQARYELQMDFESIGPLMERHGLRP